MDPCLKIVGQLVRSIRSDRFSTLLRLLGRRWTPAQLVHAGLPIETVTQRRGRTPLSADHCATITRLGRRYLDELVESLEPQKSEDWAWSERAA